MALEPRAEIVPFPMVVSVLPGRASRRSRLRGTPVDLSPIVAMLPELGQALQSGALVRIVGPQDLLDGIRAGTLRYMHGDVGHFGAVVDRHGGIVGQVQFEQASGLAQTAKAIAVFQVASAVTLQYYLQRIDQRLDQISEAVRKSREHSAWAEIGRAVSEAPRFAEALRAGSPLSPDARRRLDAEERACDVVARQELLPIEEALARLEALQRDIAGLLAEHAERGRLGKSASALLESRPGGLRSRVIADLASFEAAIPNWRISCRAAQIHFALAALQVVDDELGGRHQSGSTSRSAAGGADRHREVARRVTERLALPEETPSLFVIDRPVADRLALLREVAAVLQGESQSIADQLDLIAHDRIGELVLAQRGGEVVALAARNR